MNVGLGAHIREITLDESKLVRRSVQLSIGHNNKRITMLTSGCVSKFDKAYKLDGAYK